MDRAVVVQVTRRPEAASTSIVLWARRERSWRRSSSSPAWPSRSRHCGATAGRLAAIRGVLRHPSRRHHRVRRVGRRGRPAEMRPETHKRLMLLATISLLTVAVGRFLRQVGMGGAPNLFYGTDAFVLALVLFDSPRAVACIRDSLGGRWPLVQAPAFLRDRCDAVGSRSPMRCVMSTARGAARARREASDAHLDLRLRPL